MKSWFGLARKTNDYAKAKAEQAFNEHADPRVQVDQAIAEMQEHHAKLTDAAAHVIAQEKKAKMDLATLNQKEARLTKSIQAAMTQGHQDAARTFATDLAATREQISGLMEQIPQLEQAGNDARVAQQESADQLQTTIAKRNTILAQIDQTNMQKEMAASVAQLSDLTGHDVPSLAEIQNKVQGQFAEAQAQTELHSTDPAVLEMHVHHDEITANADDLIAQITAGTLQPAAHPELNPAPATS